MTNDKRKDPRPDEKKPLSEDKADQKPSDEAPGNWDAADFDSAVWGD
jgi:hypothetical protein